VFGTPPAPTAAHEPLRWYAVYTRGRHEKQVERLLADRAYATYLPLVPRITRWSDRSQKVEWPLFPSYVFAQFAPESLPRVLDLPGVVHVVRQNGQLAAIAVEELDNVRRFVAALTGAALPPEPAPLLSTGQWVEILTGIFAGVCGQVVATRTRKRVVVGLAALGQGFAINVEQASLRVLPEGPA
jgi:transcription antitermination factor NusG